MNTRNTSFASVFCVVSAIVLSSCGEKTPATALALTNLFDPGISPEAKTKINAFLDGIPAAEKAGIDRFEVAYVDDDGKVYSNRIGSGVRTGKIIEQAGNRIVKFANGDEIPAPVRDDFKPGNLSAQSSTFGTCNTTDGPYWRSYTKAGYAAIRGNLNIQFVSAISPKTPTTPLVAAYAYFGGQAANGASTAEGGLVYHDNSLRIFFSAPGNTYQNTGNAPVSYQEFVPPANTTLLNVGTAYPVRFQIYSNGINNSTPNGLVWVDVTANGVTTAKIIRFATTQMNVTGVDQYMKRMASIASSGFTPYNGNTSYASKNTVVMDTVKVGTLSGNAYTWTDWTSAVAFSSASDCKWPAPTAAAPNRKLVLTVPANTSASASVTTTIDMSKTQ